LTSVTTPDQIVGRQLKLERVAAGVKLIDIAARIGVSPGHLSRIEGGERKADSALIQRIRDAIQAAA
jgi:transcriptional regulator with XRE-family HTH domain